MNPTTLDEIFRKRKELGLDGGSVEAKQDYVEPERSQVDRALEFRDPVSLPPPPAQAEPLTVGATQDEVPYASAELPAQGLRYSLADALAAAPPPLPSASPLAELRPAYGPAAAVPPEPIPSETPGLKLPRLPFVPPPPAEEQEPRRAEFLEPPPFEGAPRLPMSSRNVVGKMAQLPSFQRDLPEVARGIHKGAMVQENNSTVKQAMGMVSPLLQKEAKTGNRVVVSLADKRVVVYGADGVMKATYPVMLGMASDPTPEGQFRIMENITPGPSEWYYGGHWLGFAENVPNPHASYMGFHGWQYTKDDDEEEKKNPGWKTTTHGCVQLDSKDMPGFAKLLGAGDQVTIVRTHLAVPGVTKPGLPGGR